MILQSHIKIEGLATFGEADSKKRVLSRYTIFYTQHKISAAICNWFYISGKTEVSASTRM